MKLKKPQKTRVMLHDIRKQNVLSCFTTKVVRDAFFSHASGMAMSVGSFITFGPDSNIFCISVRTKKCTTLHLQDRFVPSLCIFLIQTDIWSKINQLVFPATQPEDIIYVRESSLTFSLMEISLIAALLLLLAATATTQLNKTSPTCSLWLRKSILEITNFRRSRMKESSA